MAKEPVYWLSTLDGFDDFGRPYGNEPGAIMYDANTNRGGWANMTEESWAIHGASTKLGTARGQKYQLQENGRWLKIEG